MGAILRRPALAHVLHHLDVVLERRLSLFRLSRDDIELPEWRQAFGKPLCYASSSRIARKCRQPVLSGIFFFLMGSQGIKLVYGEPQKCVWIQPQLDQPYPCGSLPESFLKVSIFFWSSASSSRATSSFASAFALLIRAASSSRAIFSSQTAIEEGSFTTR